MAPRREDTDRKSSHVEEAPMRIRRMLTVIEEILEDGGKAAARPVKKVAAVAVIENPFAGRFVEDLQELIKTGEELGDLLGRRAVDALGAPVHSYGKAAIVGEHGEYEHAAAILRSEEHTSELQSHHDL